MGAANRARGRLRRACAIVGIPLVVIALWNPVTAVVESAESPVSQWSGSQFAANLIRGEEGPSLGLLEEDGTRKESEVPAWFEQEVLSLEGARDIRANGDWTVVGFQRDEEPDQVLARLSDEMIARGWNLMETGAVGAVTGTKGEGQCRWAAISCTVVAGETCVVVQLPGA